MRFLIPWAVLLVALVTVTACGQNDVAPSSDQARHAEFDEEFLTDGEKLYSQFKEELIIRHFFKDRRNGFFVDVGCSVPIKGRTTYYLEKHLGWSGIGVDALPGYAEAWKRERPQSVFLSYLVTDHSGSMDAFYRTEIEGLSSTEKNRVFWWKGVATELAGEEIKVPSITMNKLLEDQGVSEIDFLSMDIEGSEPGALAGFDIQRFKPKLVCIEAAPATRISILEYFNSHGYKRIEEYEKHDKVNWYFSG